MTSPIIKINKPDLSGYQSEILYSKKRFTVTEASTKSGKTFSHLYWIFELSHGGNRQWYYQSVKPGWNFWWVAPVYSQAKIAFDRIARKVAPSGKYKMYKNDLIIETPLETIIHFKSAEKYNNLYGEDVYGAVFDEFTRAREEAWFALRSTLTHTKAPCKFIGNYTGSTNWGHKLGKKANDPNGEYEYFLITALDAVNAGILDIKEVEQARKDLPQSVFDALYMAKGSLDESTLFFEDGIDNLFTNDFIKHGADHFISADIAAFGSDRFVLGVWKGFVLVEIIEKDKIDPKEIELLIRHLANKYSVPQSNIVYDADGLGTYLRGYLKGAKPFVNNSKPFKDENYYNLKSQCYYHLAKKAANNELYISDKQYQEEISRELEVIKRDTKRTDGKLKVISKDEIRLILGYSPDFADMIMMRMFFDLAPKGMRFVE